VHLDYHHFLFYVIPNHFLVHVPHAKGVWAEWNHDDSGERGRNFGKVQWLQEDFKRMEDGERARAGAMCSRPKWSLPPDWGGHRHSVNVAPDAAIGGHAAGSGGGSGGVPIVRRPPWHPGEVRLREAERSRREAEARKRHKDWERARHGRRAGVPHGSGNGAAAGTGGSGALGGGFIVSFLVVLVVVCGGIGGAVWLASENAWQREMHHRAE
jgi:hypothetical protein